MEGDDEVPPGVGVLPGRTPTPGGTSLEQLQAELEDHKLYIYELEQELGLDFSRTTLNLRARRSSVVTRRLSSSSRSVGTVSFSSRKSSKGQPHEVSTGPPPSSSSASGTEPVTDCEQADLNDRRLTIAGGARGKYYPPFLASSVLCSASTQSQEHGALYHQPYESPSSTHEVLERTVRKLEERAAKDRDHIDTLEQDLDHEKQRHEKRERFVWSLEAQIKNLRCSVADLEEERNERERQKSSCLERCAVLEREARDYRRLLSTSSLTSARGGFRDNPPSSETEEEQELPVAPPPTARGTTSAEQLEDELRSTKTRLHSVLDQNKELETLVEELTKSLQDCQVQERAASDEARLAKRLAENMTEKVSELESEVEYTKQEMVRDLQRQKKELLREEARTRSGGRREKQSSPSPRPPSREARGDEEHCSEKNWTEDWSKAKQTSCWADFAQACFRALVLGRSMCRRAQPRSSPVWRK